MSSQDLLNHLDRLVSEERNSETMDLDKLSALELVSKINQQDKLVPLAIENELPNIAKAVDHISSSFRKGGRLIYVGAGTSGRLGVLDASECPPTFGVDESMVIGLIAGGHEAMFRSRESAEDSALQGQQDLIEQNLNVTDVVLGIAASGRTPYVIGALEYANTVGALTISLACNSNSAIAEHARIAITPIVGPEVLTGSTRMKAGTAQKLVLNMLTTASMVRIGKSYQNLMVDVQASNEKLVARAIRIVMQATECSESNASEALRKSQNNVKIAILMQLTGATFEAASAQLESTSGFLRAAIEKQ